MTEDEFLEQLGIVTERLSNAMMEIAKLHSEACLSRKKRMEKSRWTEKDVKDAKAIKQLFPTCKCVYRDMYGLTIEYEKVDSICSHIFYTGSNILPTLRRGDEKVEIESIIGGAE